MIDTLIAGTIKTYNTDGKPFQEYSIDDKGQKHGTHQSWYSNGQLHLKCEYLNGNLHGEHKTWNNNGQLHEQSEWVNGKRHSIRYVWHNDGYLRYIMQYDNGEKLVEVIFEQDNQRLKKPILTITEPNHAKVGDGLIQVIKVLQEKGIKFKIAKIGDK